MSNDIRNFSRFFTLLKLLPGADRKALVYNYTGGRTDSLRDLTSREYNALCNDMERTTDQYKIRESIRHELRMRRSAALKLMQLIGVDTTNWARVDAFCMHPRIAGKRFCKLSTEELEALATKLRIIHRKGGIKQHEDKESPGEVSFVFVNMSNSFNNNRNNGRKDNGGC